jgi:hypothetical protein
VTAPALLDTAEGWLIDRLDVAIEENSTKPEEAEETAYEISDGDKAGDARLYTELSPDNVLFCDSL